MRGWSLQPPGRRCSPTPVPAFPPLRKPRASRRSPPSPGCLGFAGARMWVHQGSPLPATGAGEPAAHESEGGGPAGKQPRNRHPLSPPQPPLGICSGEKQPFQSGRLPGPRSGQAPSAAGYVGSGLGPAHVRADPPGAGPARAVRAPDHAAALAARARELGGCGAAAF